MNTITKEAKKAKPPTAEEAVDATVLSEGPETFELTDKQAEAAKAATKAEHAAVKAVAKDSK